MGPSYVLDKSFSIDDAAGVGQFLAVVQGANDGTCKKPGAANAPAFLGFTQEAQSHQNRGVNVRMLGISFATAGAAIAAGDRVKIGANTGKIASCEAVVTAAPGAAANTEVIGMALETATADGDVISVLIARQIVNIAAS